MGRIGFSNVDVVFIKAAKIAMARATPSLLFQGFLLMVLILPAPDQLLSILEHLLKVSLL